MKKISKKKQIIPLVVFIVIVVIVGLIIKFGGSSSDNPINNKVFNKYKKDFAEVVSGPLSDYNMTYVIDDEFVIFSNDKYRISYYFDDKKLSSIGIDVDLNNNTLSGEDTVKEIEEIYSVVTNDLSSIKKYLKNDFYITDKFSLNKYDREHIIDLLEYKESCSSWSTYYRYEDDHKYLSVSYALYERYDKEGYSSFYIDIY